MSIFAYLLFRNKNLLWILTLYYSFLAYSLTRSSRSTTVLWLFGFGMLSEECFSNDSTRQRKFFITFSDNPRAVAAVLTTLVFITLPSFSAGYRYYLPFSCLLQQIWSSTPFDDSAAKDIDIRILLDAIDYFC
jgi:hypothetical protein